MGNMGRFFLILGSLFAFLSVALGAFGAHILRTRLDSGDLAIFQTGVQYQGYHALALLLVGAGIYAMPAARRLNWTGTLFTFGIVVFSGSLYLLVATGTRWLGAITPIGGVCFLLGWLTLLVEAVRLPANRNP
jgi:uncharacterized membrane protein YgdD (TMEM256/DUF423 family)